MTAKALIIGDDDVVRSFEAQVLERNGYTCSLAAAPGEAAVMLEDSEFDVALVDINLPGRSGLDVAAEICRKHPRTTTIMVTGVDDVQTAKQALGLGAHGYVAKPFKPKELVSSVTNAIERHMWERERGTRAEGR